jgi:hypothetical protein
MGEVAGRGGAMHAEIDRAIQLWRQRNVPDVTPGPPFMWAPQP